MAGYDYTYIVGKSRREDTQSFLKYIKRVYKNYKIDSFYRTKDLGESVEVYIYVDGRMPMLQLAERNILEDVSRYSLVMNKNEKFRKEVILPFINGSRDGISNITNMVYDLKNSFKSIAVDADVSDKIVPTELINKLDDKDSIVSKYISIVDNWYHESISNNQCLLLIDQFLEETNKYLLNENNSSRGYIEVLEEAINMNFIDEPLKEKLLEVHKMRNKTQHRGYSPGISDVNYVIDIGFKYLNCGVFLKR